MTTTTAARKSLDWIPDELTFYPHQLEGIRWLAQRSAWLLSDEMGLGKSIQALTVFAIDVQRGLAEKCLVVCPVSLKGNWADEIQKNTKFPSHVLDGTPKQRERQLAEFAERDGPRILIVNYEQVIPHHITLSNMEFDAVIYDEAHWMKNPKAKRTKACQALVAPRHYLLTGSPLLNDARDLWSLLHRINPDEFPNYWKFVQRYCVFGGYERKQVVAIKNEKELRTKLQAHQLRRLKKDVLDLPDKQYVKITVELSPEQRALYREINEELRLTMPDVPDPMDIENALVKFLRLKQVCGTTACFDGYQDTSWKLDRVMDDSLELLENGHRPVIFTQFRGVQEALMARFHAAKVEPYWLNGDTPFAERVPTVNAWAKDDPKPIICMLQVAGIGLNMTASSHALFVDKLFVPKLNEQAEDRLHRIGADATQPVQIREYITAKTIESRVEAILRSKRKVFDALVETSDFKKKLYQALLEEDNE